MGLNAWKFFMARKTKPLTDTEIKAAKPQDKDYQLYDSDGLRLLIKSSGSKLWQFRYYRPLTSPDIGWQLFRDKTRDEPHWAFYNLMINAVAFHYTTTLILRLTFLPAPNYSAWLVNTPFSIFHWPVSTASVIVSLRKCWQSVVSMSITLPFTAGFNIMRHNWTRNSGGIGIIPSPSNLVSQSLVKVSEG